jgi:hypothetical protein
MGLAMLNFGTMHLIHRPHRRLSLTEKFSAFILFMVLFMLIGYAITTAPPTFKPPKEPQEKYYTIVLSEHEYNQLKKLYVAYQRDIPNSALITK